MAAVFSGISIRVLDSISTAPRKVVDPSTQHECLFTLLIHFQFWAILKRGHTVFIAVQGGDVHADTTLDQAFEVI